MVDPQESDHLRLGGGQERFAAAAGREVENVIGREVVQKAGSVGPSDLDFAARRLIDEDHSGASLVVFGNGIAEMIGHEEAHFLDEDGSFGGGWFVEGCALGHDGSPLPDWSARLLWIGVRNGGEKLSRPGLPGLCLLGRSWRLGGV